MYFMLCAVLQQINAMVWSISDLSTCSTVSSLFWNHFTFEEFTLERMHLLVTVALPGPYYNNAFPPELKITIFQMVFA